jgi:hypothetical protein
VSSKLIAYAFVCAAAALSPVLAIESASSKPRFTGFPTTFEGRPLSRLPDTPEERAFYGRHALEHARFSDGERVLLMRWAGADITGFHLAEACFRAFGFTLSPMPARSDSAAREHCYRARRKGVAQRVCEQIRDGQGQVFASEPTWQLARVLGQSPPPYLGISVVELEPPL